MRNYILAFAAAALLTPAVEAQNTAQPAKTASPARAATSVPRTADGKPDLNGVWQPGSDRVGTWEEANQGVGVPEPGKGHPVTTGGPRPYQPWAAKKALESYNLRRIDEPVARCLPELNLPGISLYPEQIVQTPQTIVFLIEERHLFRIIPINAKHPDDLDPGYLGDSVGHWEGDTLVVDVTGFSEKMSGINLNSDALHITERYTRVDYNTIEYEATSEDPKVLTRPWTIHSKIMLRPGTRIRESVCEENNQDPERYEKLLKDGLVQRHDNK